MEDKKLLVWRMAGVVEGANPDEWRLDMAGAWINFNEFEMTTAYGWNIDLIKPAVCGGKDDIENLQPLHWRNHKHKGINYPEYETRVTSKGDKNIWLAKFWNAGKEL